MHWENIIYNRQQHTAVATCCIYITCLSSPFFHHHHNHHNHNGHFIVSPVHINYSLWLKCIIAQKDDDDSKKCFFSPLPAVATAIANQNNNFLSTEIQACKKTYFRSFYVPGLQI